MKRLVLDGILFLIPSNGYRGVIEGFYWVPAGVYADSGDLIKVREVMNKYHLFKYLNTLK